MAFWIFIVGLIPANEYSFDYDAIMTTRVLWIYSMITMLTYTYEHIRLRHHKQIFDMFNKTKKRINDLERLGLLDPITEINNMNGFNKNSDAVLRLASNENKPLSLLMIDIDFFKDFNNSHGQKAGDTALKMLADILDNCACRPLDMVVRIENDKFGALLFDTNIRDANWIAKKLCVDIESQSTILPNGKTAKITVSIGIASQVPDDSSNLNFNSLFDAADRNLRKAKENGYNRVISD
jgi:diguanylate cyclase (GGDEF)-like protein